MDPKKEKLIAELKQAHEELKAIEKYHRVGKGSYLRNMVYGANDGIITTFAVVAGVAGAQLPIKVVLILGVANLVADGISMAMGNFLGTKSENDFKRKERQMEAMEVDLIPEEERKEIEEIYRKKGFKGELLIKAVDAITSDKKIWVDEMMVNELNIIPNEDESPGKNALATFMAFGAAGFLPLMPYIFGFSYGGVFQTAIIMTGLALFAVGSVRTIFTKKNWILAGLEMLLVGAAAAAVSYGLGYWLTLII
ncbi:MAG: VIT1/CCC1 transporter family protein [Candidatus Komeilibacteria bacterium]|nr:VIT1/CCC1 transporter family protein [Candidatus Komeilibacteria bacterium]